MISTAASEHHREFRKNSLLKGLFAAYVSIWIVTAINPVYPFDWLLENLLVFVAFALLTFTYRRFPFSDLSYILIFLFMSLHAVGAHYTYSEVPFGFWLKEVFDLSRNHYDRLIHFGFGLLIFYPLREVALRLVTRTRSVAGLIALTFVFTFSSGFEIIEWCVAQIVDPDAGQAYLGTQGDVFDTQKDMGLAAVGAVIALAATDLFSRREHPL